jgi:hypothetical protein
MIDSFGLVIANVEDPMQSEVQIDSGMKSLVTESLVGKVYSRSLGQAGKDQIESKESSH